MGGLEMVLPCYLIRMSDGMNVLIDSGTPAGYHTPGMPESGRATDVIRQLAGLGLTPSDIDVVICTHFDVDHAGHHDDFPQAEFVVQRAHYELSRNGHPRAAAARPHWDHPALRYRLVDGDTELFPGVTLLETSGHAPGHQSVLVRLPQTRTVLLVIDAVLFERLFTPERPALPMDEDKAQTVASTRKLLDVAKRENAALVVFGHDGLQWDKLKKAPEWYG
jgi:N-acyl homoserine lactone hydrolase